MNKHEIGVMLSEISFPNMPLLFKNVGFDFFIIDFEHGGFDYADMARIVTVAKLAKITVLIRLADNNRKDIIKFMDMGANGLILPMTNTKEDIEQVVKYAKYAPLGKRGISTMRAHTLYNPGNLDEYMEEVNNSTKIYAQIETVQGISNFKDIMNVIGVDGFFLGPNDLSIDLKYGKGCSSNLAMIITDLKKEVRKYNKTAGIITNNEELLEVAKQADYDIFSIGSELTLLKIAGKLTLSKIKNTCD